MPGNPPDGERRSIAIALSGGGHRAALFALGALMYVVDAGGQRDTTSIASVSGGSLTNGFLAQTLDFQKVDSGRFEREVAGPLASQIAQRGTLFAPVFTKIYLAVLGIGLAAAFVPWFFPLVPWWTRVSVSAALVIGWGWLLALRGRVCARAFAVTLFSPSGRPTPLRSISTTVSHVICATELRTAESVYFAGDFVYGFQFGPGLPGSTLLYRAVQASAAFPGGFPPVRIPTRTHGFTPHQRAGLPSQLPRNLILSDGGVYDNMGDQWARGFRRRTEVWPWLAEQKPVPNQLVVVNSSARVPWVPFRLGRIPLVSEFAALKRVNDIMYINTTNVRRQEIVKSFDPTHPDRAGEQLPGVLVQIAQSPFVVADAFSKVGDKSVASRAENVIGALGPENREKWAAVARRNADVPTTLAKLGTQGSARLLYHGYVLAMCNLHVIFGGAGGPQDEWPLLPVPTLERFANLITGGGTSQKAEGGRLAHP